MPKSKRVDVFYGGPGSTWDFAILARSWKEFYFILTSGTNASWRSLQVEKSYWSRMPNDNPNHPELRGKPVGLYYTKKHSHGPYVVATEKLQIHMPRWRKLGENP